MKRFLAQRLVSGVRTMPVVALLALAPDTDAARDDRDRSEGGTADSGRGDKLIFVYRCGVVAVLVLLVAMLSACSERGGQQSMCPPASQETLRPMRTGYYPGYGCGFIPPAQTNFS